MRGETLKGHLDLLLLAVLRDGAVHGYEIIRRLAARSDGAFELAEGTVYPALRRLEQEKLLRSRWQTAEGRRRRVYQLTAAGKTALDREEKDWNAFRAAVARVVEVPT